MSQKNLQHILATHETTILDTWIQEQATILGKKINAQELKTQSKNFLSLLKVAISFGEVENINAPAWTEIKKFLSEISRSRGTLGFTPAETATFIFSLKRPLFEGVRAELISTPEDFAREIWQVTQLVDKLGLFTMEAYQKIREEVIVRQQEEMLELSTPVVKLWDGILALPMIGTLDSSRTQIVMENLLQKIMETESEIAIIDITGVPTVDTLVAQHLIKTVTAARLMGAECIISGIRPQIAATIVHLGVDLGNVATKSSLADAFMLALSRTNRSVTNNQPKLRA